MNNFQTGITAFQLKRFASKILFTDLQHDVSSVCSHLHDGPGLHLPVRVRQSAHHLRHQASRDLADLQLDLPLLHHPL